jgi:hypothetical protein
VLALAVGALVLAGWFPNVVVPDTGPGRIGLISSLYDPPDRSIEVALNVGDGQIFATQAVDPLADRPETVLGGPEEQAYRWQRGAYGWIGWVASAGQAEAAPWALAVVTVLATGALVGVVAEVIRRRGGRPLAALLLLLTPGVITDLLFIGPEVLGTALVVAGVALALRRPGSWGAVALLAAAGLCRETLLLVPAVLALVALRRRQWDAAVRLALAAAPYVAWVLVLRLRLGAWPTGSSGGRLGLVPFGGMVEEMGGWGPDDIAGLALVAALGLAGLVRARDTGLRAVLAAHVVLAASFGPAVWSEAAHAGRVLLPLAALGLVAVASARGAGKGEDLASDGDAEPAPVAARA